VKNKAVKLGQAASATANAATNSAGPSTTSTVSYSAFWPVVLSLAGLSLLGWYAYKNWFGSSEEDEEAEKEHTAYLSDNGEIDQEGKRRVVIKL